jgi:hypothetical protein
MPSNYTKPNGKKNGKTMYKPDPNRFIFNVDTLWFTIDIDNYDEVMDSGLKQVLMEGRESLADGDEPHVIEIDLRGYENNLLFEIGGGQKPVYAYQIRNEDYAFYFTKRKREDKTFPVKVQINQFKLWDKGAIDAYIEAIYILGQLGFICGQAKANRIDLCCHSDQFIWKLDDLKDFKYPENIAKDNKPNWQRLDPETGEFETVYYGDRSRLQLRIYNKSKEIKDKQKFYFNQIYEQKGIDPEKVWNIEFELHRDILKEYVHPTTGENGYFDDLENLLSVEGLSYLWTHLTLYKFGHDTPFWKRLRKGDPKKFIETKDYILTTKDIDSSKMREVAQIRGRLMKLVLTEDNEVGSELNEAIKQFINLVDYYEDEKEKDFEKDLNRRRQKYVDAQINGLVKKQHLKIAEINLRNRTENKKNNPESTGLSR